MARIRSVKPEFWTDEKIVELSAFARLLFIGLWNFADDEGRMVYSPKRIKMQVFPSDSLDISELFGEIRREKLVTIYVVEDVEYLQINNFDKHQKIDKRSPSKLPECPCAPPNPAESPRIPTTEGIKEGNGKEGNGKERKNKSPAAPEFDAGKALSELGAKDPALSDYLKLRKAKRAPVTETVIADLQSEAMKAGLSIHETLVMCCSRGWQGFKAEWLEKKSAIQDNSRDAKRENVTMVLTKEGGGRVERDITGEAIRIA